jgi:hypothetical protein
MALRNPHAQGQIELADAPTVAHGLEGGAQTVPIQQARRWRCHLRGGQ